jgi:type II secretory pathway component GspD/PulD (secretin)
VALYLEAVQLRATRQIRIEARVFRVVLRGGSLARDAAGAAVVAADLDTAIATLRAAGDAALVAAPSLVAMNNEAALIQLDEAVAPAAAPAPGLNALSLVVTAQVSADGFVQLSVAPRLEAGTPQSVPDPPVTFAADTIVRLREGETVMISGVPSGRERRTEWVVLLTPALVTTARPMQAGAR